MSKAVLRQNSLKYGATKFKIWNFVVVDDKL